MLGIFAHFRFGICNGILFKIVKGIWDTWAPFQGLITSYRNVYSQLNHDTYSRCHNEFNKFNNTTARMLDSVYHMTLSLKLYISFINLLLKRDKMLNKVSKGAKIRNRYNQVHILTQDTNGKVTNS